MTLTATAAWCGCSARAARNERSRSARRPCGRSRPGSRRARPQLVTADSGPAMFVGERGNRIDPRVVRRIVHRALRHCRGRTRPRAARTAARDGHPSARGRRRPAQRPGDARPRLAGHHADLHPRHQRTARSGVRAGPPPGLNDCRAEPVDVRPSTSSGHNRVITSSSGSLSRPLSQSIRCRWQPVARPVLPTYPITWPRRDPLSGPDHIPRGVVVGCLDPNPVDRSVVEEQPIAVRRVEVTPASPLRRTAAGSRCRRRRRSRCRRAASRPSAPDGTACRTARSPRQGRVGRTHGFPAVRPRHCSAQPASPQRPLPGP